MFKNRFSIRVLGGQEIDDGYVRINHDKQYSLVMRNSRFVRCDVAIEIDGQSVGAWRIEAHETITIDRSVLDTGIFTFCNLGTPEAVSTGLDASNQDLGLIKAIFRPEHRTRPVPVRLGPWRGSTGTWPKNTGPTLSAEPAMGAAFMSAATQAQNVSSTLTSSDAGGTGLSGESDQRFYPVDPLNYDPAQQTTIHLRLVLGNGNPRPLTNRVTPIPPPIH